MAHKEIDIPISIVIASGESHRTAKICRPRFGTDIRERATSIVAIDMVRGGIICDIEVHIVIVIKIAKDGLHASTTYCCDSCFIGCIGKSAVPVVPIEDVILGFKDMRIQGTRYGFSRL